MDYTEKEIQAFVEEQLRDHGEWLTRRFRGALEKNRNRNTGTLIGSLSGDSFEVRPSQGGATLAIDILEYGRLMEIGGRKRRLKQKNHDVWERRNHRPKGKRVDWYNKNRYGGYGHLVRTLTAGMTDAELDRIRGILQRAKDDFAAKT